MLPTFAETDTWGIISQWVGPAATGVLAYFWKRFQRMHSALMKRLDAIDAMKQRLDVIEPIAKQLKADFSPNGGGSILDLIQRIQTQLCVVDARAKVVWATSRDGVYECDANGKNIWVNASLSLLFGMDATEMAGSGWLRGVAREDRQRAWDNWTAAVKDRIPYEDVYTVVNQITGQRVRCQTYTIQTIDPSTRHVIGYFGLVMRLDGDTPPVRVTHTTTRETRATGTLNVPDRPPPQVSDTDSEDGMKTPEIVRTSRIDPPGESDVP